MLYSHYPLLLLIELIAFGAAVYGVFRFLDRVEKRRSE
jgi:hypothetical protein